MSEEFVVVLELKNKQKQFFICSKTKLINILTINTAKVRISSFYCILIIMILHRMKMALRSSKFHWRTRWFNGDFRMLVELLWVWRVQCLDFPKLMSYFAIPFFYLNDCLKYFLLLNSLFFCCFLSSFNLLHRIPTTPHFLSQSNLYFILLQK